MFKPVQMCKVIVAGSKRVLEDTIQIMHSLGVVHIEDYHSGKYEDAEKYFDIGTPFERASVLSEQLVRARVILNSLKILPSKDAEIKLRGDEQKRLDELENTLEEFYEKRAEIDAKLSEMSTLREPLEFIDTIKIEPKFLQPTQELALFKGVVEKDPTEKIRDVTKKFHIFTAPLKDGIAVVLFVLWDEKEKVQKVLNELKFREVHMPLHIKNMHSLKDLEDEKQKLLSLKKGILEKIEKIKQQNAEFLIGYENYLRKEDEKAEAPLKFAESENAFVVEGYVPIEKERLLEKTLKEKLKNAVYVERGEECEFAPTELKNPGMVSSFEFFLDLYSRPLYKEIDPTMFIFLAFPLFFGFMLGDIGYGIVSMMIFYLVRIKWVKLRGLLNAMMLAASASIAFGFLFGEFFGTLLYNPIINREHDINFMLLITILVGIVHINLGILLGAYNTFMQKGFRKALYNNLSWFVIEVGAIVFALRYFGVFEFVYTVHLSAGLLLIGIALLYKGHGAIGLMELPTMMSNILSYARLFALGLASVSLALIVNEFATTFWHMGLVYIPVAIAILVLGHMINLALGIIGCFLQSLRLHYVEFLTKFYRGGGERYMPFGR